MRKPNPFIRKFEYPDGRKGQTEIAKVFEDYFSEDFAEAGDPISVRFDAHLFGGDVSVFEGYGPKDQVEIARGLAKFFEKYANFIEHKDKNQAKLKIKIES